MIRFDSIAMQSDRPVYIQLAEHVKRQIYLGAAQDGDELPSRREIAAQANVNPNTVQKAYRLMEEEGYVVTEGNRPSSLRITPEVRQRIDDELTRGLVLEFVAAARRNKLSYKKLIQLLSELWDDEE